MAIAQPGTDRKPVLPIFFPLLRRVILVSMKRYSGFQKSDVAMLRSCQTSRGSQSARYSFRLTIGSIIRPPDLTFALIAKKRVIK